MPNLPNFLTHSLLPTYLYPSLASLLNSSSQSSILQQFVHQASSDLSGDNPDCMNGSYGLYALGFASTMSLGFFVQYWLFYCCCCVESRIKKSQDPETCTCFHGLQWGWVCMHSKSYAKGNCTKAIVSLLLTFYLIGGIITLAIADFHETNCTFPDTASLTVYIIMALMGIPATLFGCAGVWPCVHFGNDYPVVVELEQMENLAVLEEDGTVDFIPNDHLAYYRHSKAYFEFPPILSLAIMYAGSSNLIMSLAGLLQYFKTSSAMPHYERMKDISDDYFSIVPPIFVTIYDLAVLFTCGCIRCTCCPAKKGKPSHDVLEHIRRQLIRHPSSLNSASLYQPAQVAPSSDIAFVSTTQVPPAGTPPPSDTIPLTADLSKE